MIHEFYENSIQVIDFTNTMKIITPGAPEIQGQVKLARITQYNKEHI